VLTSRQTQVVRMVASGATSKQIAADLGVTERAVKARLTRLYRALGVSGRAHLVATVLAGEAASDTEPLDHDFSGYDDTPYLVSVTAGPQHRVAYLNNAWERRGIKTKGVLGRPVASMLVDDPRQIALMDEAFRTGATRSLRRHRTRALVDGEERFERIFDVVFQPLRDAAGRIGGLVVIITEPDD
jgi:DNA-binding CsgD family transcriptional regulator